MTPDERARADGWQLVPKEPTKEMLSALWSTYQARPWVEAATACYQAMLAAAPQPEPAPSQYDVEVSALDWDGPAVQLREGGHSIAIKADIWPRVRQQVDSIVGSGPEPASHTRLLLNSRDWERDARMRAEARIAKLEEALDAWLKRGGYDQNGEPYGSAAYSPAAFTLSVLARRETIKNTEASDGD